MQSDQASNHEGSKSTEYWVFDPVQFAFPPPRVPVLPGLNASSFGTLSQLRYRIVGQGERRQEYRFGRYALLDAFEAAGIGPDTAALVPSYHCRTMLDPVIALGGHLALYRLTPDLQPDINALEALISNSPVPVRALLVTHYFGFAQPMLPLVEFCQSHRLVLIEDCSHALIDDAQNPRLGQHGRFVITSPYKFFPSGEGGWLIDRSQSDQSRSTRMHWQLRHELREAARLCQHLKRKEPGVSLAGSEPLPVVPQSVGKDYWLPEAQSGTSSLFRIEDQQRPPSLISRAINLICSVERIASQRRRNYRRWAAALHPKGRCRPLWPELPDGTTPYMFPLLIDSPDIDFVRLKRRGLPIWRWDELAVSDCPVAQASRLRLLHLPCHQALSQTQIDWMISTVQDVLTS